MADATRVIIAMAVVCGLAVLIMAVPKAGRQLLRFAVRAALCLAVIYGLNLIVPEGFRIGINPLTAGVCGVLGLPGLAAMIVLRVML